MNNNYNFDIKQLLDKFNDDPEKLANAFADALNDELAKRRNEDAINDAAENVADEWNYFIDEYFKVKSLPDGITEDDLYIDSEAVKAIVEIFVKAAPYVSLLQEYATKLETISNKMPEVVQKTGDDFSKTMAKFFKNNDI